MKSIILVTGLDLDIFNKKTNRFFCGNKLEENDLQPFSHDYGDNDLDNQAKLVKFLKAPGHDLKQEFITHLKGSIQDNNESIVTKYNEIEALNLNTCQLADILKESETKKSFWEIFKSIIKEKQS